ncbi:MAG: deacylase, partial [Desulfovibrio sp.]|nr:deacylase [Desulfovibrio sp.]
GEVLPVTESLRIHPHNGFRINAIGFPGKGRDDSGVTLRHKNFMKHYSVDRQGTLYRIEVYKKQRITGMFLARFGNAEKTADARPLLPSVPGPESSLGY